MPVSKKINKKILNRVLQEAYHILATKGTVESTAKEFGVSYKTTYDDLTKRLPLIDPKVYDLVQELLSLNLRIAKLLGNKTQVSNLIRPKKMNTFKSRDEDVKDRAVRQARYLLLTKGTMESTAEAFGVSITTTYHDLTRRLWDVDQELYKLVRDFTEFNRKVNGFLITAKALKKSGTEILTKKKGA